MPDQVGLVIGPTGATGGPIAAALARRSGWRVYGMSRTAPLHEVPFTHLVADLTDPESCRRALELVGIAAVLYLRLRPQPRQKSHYGARHLRGDLPGTQCAPGLSRKRRRLFRAVRIVGRDRCRFERRWDLLMQKTGAHIRSWPKCELPICSEMSAYRDKPEVIGAQSERRD